MKALRLAGFVTLVLLAVAVAAQQAPSYQTATVLAVTKLPSQTPQGGTDAPLAINMDRYDIRVQVGETAYTVRYETIGGSNLDHLKGRKFQVRVKGKAMYAKTALGDEIKLRIVSSEKAPAS